MKCQNGFTLIELMFVISIIGLLAAIAMPNVVQYRDRACLVEGYQLADPIRRDICDFYEFRGKFPRDSVELGYTEKIKGKYVDSIEVKHGSIDITFGENANAYNGYTMTLKPVINEAYPTGPVLWEQQGTREEDK